MVKTPPFHGGNMSSNLVRVIPDFRIKMEDYPSPAEGNGLENRQAGSARAWVRIPHPPYIIAGWSSLVARRAHNPKVIGSNPVPAIWSLGVGVITPPCHGGDHRSESGRDRKWLDSSVGRAKD